MKKLLIAMAAFGGLTASAQAGLVCATGPELKVLQSSALQQQLMVAALTCHMRDDYNHFVATYREGLVQFDTALKAFFAARPRGEGYNAYKTRIANTASLRSVHDPRFCASARKVFDMALRRPSARRGLAPEPPQLVDTGYEGCRAVDDVKLVAAKMRPAVKLAVVPKPLPRPAVATRSNFAEARAASLRMVKPLPAPKPMVTAEAARALALRPRQNVLPIPANPAVRVAPKPVLVATAAPTVPVKPFAAPKPAIAADAAAMPSRPIAVSAPPHSQFAGPKPQSAPRSDRLDRRAYIADVPYADEDPLQSETAEPVAPAPPRYTTATVQRNAAPARDAWRAPAADPDDPYADNPLPNAYRPGAEWVDDPGRSWHPARYDGPPRRPRAHWVLDPDGRWVLVVPRGPRWGWD